MLLHAPPRYCYVVFLLLSVCVVGHTMDIFVESKAERFQDIDILPPPYDPRIIENGDLEQQAKELAKLYIAGMVSGYEFTYIPSSRSRNISETWILKEREYRIEESRMTLLSFEETKNSYLGRYRYNVNAEQELWIQSWEDEVVYTHSGLAGVPVQSDLAATKKKVIHDAIYNAVDAQLRKILSNKPAQVSGYVLLEKAPQIFQEEENEYFYTARVHTMIFIRNIRKYTIY